MNRWWRILKHRSMDESDVARVLPPAALARIGQRVAESERRHSGEIRVCVEAGLPLADLWARCTPRARALAQFSAARVWDTEANNGVLIYLLLAEHAIEIVADRGLNPHVPPAHWQQVVGTMRQHFREGRFEQGLAQAVDAVDAVLTRHFPVAERAANPNELPDAPLVL